MNEVEQFLQDTNQSNTVDVLEQPLVATPSSENTTGATGAAGEGGATGAAGEDGLKPRNRRERRLAAALDAERKANIFQAGKLEAFSEAKSAVTEEADYLKAIERIYGTDSPETLLATDLLKKAIVGARDDAENRAYDRIKSERQKEAEEQRNAAAELDTMIDEIEEEYGVTLTEPQEKAFFTLLTKMSPKDKQGNVTEYADAHAVWEVFSEKLNKPNAGNTRAKDMSSRSMTQSGASVQSNLQNDTTAQFLKEQGII